MEEYHGHFSLIDVFRESVHVLFIATGCYCGWKVGVNFLSLFVGGVVGRIVGIALHMILLSVFEKKDHDRAVTGRPDQGGQSVSISPDVSSANDSEQTKA